MNADRNALAAYSTMLRDDISPALRALGLRGSGSRFVLPNDSTWMVIAFQKSQFNSADHVRFTVNLTIANKAAWAAALEEGRLPLPASPSGNTHHYSWTPERMVRLGTVMPDKSDRWWGVRADPSTESVAAEVTQAIRDFGIPWLLGQMSPQIPHPDDPLE
jgi:hypothetical protein